MLATNVFHKSPLLSAKHKLQYIRFGWRWRMDVRL